MRLTTTSTTTRGTGSIAFRLAVLALVASLTRAADARAGGCGGEEGKPPPPAGHYKGTYKLVYTLQFTGVPPSMKPTVTWSGDLSFDLGRPELDDSPRPLPPPPPPLRNPLKPPRKAGD